LSRLFIKDQEFLPNRDIPLESGIKVELQGKGLGLYQRVGFALASDGASFDVAYTDLASGDGLLRFTVPDLKVRVKDGGEFWLKLLSSTPQANVTIGPHAIYFIDEPDEEKDGKKGGSGKSRAEAARMIQAGPGAFVLGAMEDTLTGIGKALASTTEASSAGTKTISQGGTSSASNTQAISSGGTADMDYDTEAEGEVQGSAEQTITSTGQVSTGGQTISQGGTVTASTAQTMSSGSTVEANETVQTSGAVSGTTQISGGGTAGVTQTAQAGGTASQTQTVQSSFAGGTAAGTSQVTATQTGGGGLAGGTVSGTTEVSGGGAVGVQGTSGLGGSVSAAGSTAAPGGGKVSGTVEAGGKTVGGGGTAGGGISAGGAGAQAAGASGQSSAEVEAKVEEKISAEAKTSAAGAGTPPTGAAQPVGAFGGSAGLPQAPTPSEPGTKSPPPAQAAAGAPTKPDEVKPQTTLPGNGKVDGITGGSPEQQKSVSPEGAKAGKEILDRLNKGKGLGDKLNLPPQKEGDKTGGLGAAPQVPVRADNKEQGGGQGEDKGASGKEEPGALGPLPGEEKPSGLAPGTQPPLMPGQEPGEDDQQQPGAENQPDEKQERDEEAEKNAEDEEQQDQDKQTLLDNLQDRSKQTPLNETGLDESVKEITDQASNLMNAFLMEQVVVIWVAAIPSFGLSILLGAILGDFIWLVKGAVIRRVLTPLLKTEQLKKKGDEIAKQIKISGKVKVNIVAMNLITILAPIAFILFVIVVACNDPTASRLIAVYNNSGGEKVTGAFTGNSDICSAFSIKNIVSGGSSSSTPTSGGGTSGGAGATGNFGNQPPASGTNLRGPAPAPPNSPIAILSFIKPWSGSDPYPTLDWGDSDPNIGPTVKQNLQELKNDFDSLNQNWQLLGRAPLQPKQVYRPQDYQTHYRTVWEIFAVINNKDNTQGYQCDQTSHLDVAAVSQAYAQATAAEKQTLQNEFTKHEISLGSTPAGCVSDHASGIAMDIEDQNAAVFNISLYSSLVSTAQNFGLCHNIAGDQPHFALKDKLPAGTNCSQP
jgi:hypothetical protein